MVRSPRCWLLPVFTMPAAFTALPLSVRNSASNRSKPWSRPNRWVTGKALRNAPVVYPASPRISAHVTAAGSSRFSFVPCRTRRPCRYGFWPVRMDACDTGVTAAWAIAWRKSAPSAAIRSRFGVSDLESS